MVEKKRANKREGTCLGCSLCVRACDNLGIHAIKMQEQDGAKVAVSADDDISSSCLGCGSCAAVCRTNYIPCIDDENTMTRTIWGRKYTLVACEECGVIVDTEEVIAEARKRQEVPYEEGEDKVLCHACKRKAVADKMASVHP